MQQETAIGHALPSAAAESQVAHAEHAPVTNRANSKLAMWLFLGSEVMFFTVLIGAYVFARFAHPEEHAHLNVPLTSLNTFLLLMSSFTVVRSLAAIQAGNIVKFQRSLIMTLILGVAFFAIMMVEYTALSHEGITLNSGAFGFAFFTLTGFHGFHVLIGLVWLVYVFNRAFNGHYSKADYWGVEFWGLYWHFVDVVWIFIFTVVYLI